MNLKRTNVEHMLGIAESQLEIMIQNALMGSLSGSDGSLTLVISNGSRQEVVEDIRKALLAASFLSDSERTDVPLCKLCDEYSAGADQTVDARCARLREWLLDGLVKWPGFNC